MSFKPGSTFDYSGLVKGLDPEITWSAAASVKEPLTDVPLGDLTVILEPTDDFDATGDYLIRLYATAEETTTWIPKIGSALKIVGDIKFFDLDAPDPVVRTETFCIPVSVRITE
jgi:hypothetical protein